MKRIHVRATINMSILADDDADLGEVLADWLEESLGAGEAADVEDAAVTDYRITDSR